MTKNYYALMFDIVNSRSYYNRYELQIRVRKIMNYLNKIYSRYMEKEVICQSGDEFQGLFTDCKAAYNYARQFSLLAYPVEIRSAIGVGQIDYFNIMWESSNINGESYYNARKALNDIPKDGEYLIFINSNERKDYYFNTINNSNGLLKNNESETSHLLELLIELNSPLIDEMSLFNNILYNELIEIISYTNDLKTIAEEESDFYRSYKKISKLNINFDYLKQILLDYAYRDKFKIKKTYDYTKPKIYNDGDIPFGTSKLLATLLETSPQNINRHVNVGHIAEIRANESILMELLEKEY